MTQSASFPFYYYRAKLLRVVDGDTIHVEVDLGLDETRKLKVRLTGINAPELSTQEGKAVRDALTKRCPVNIIIQTTKDKQEKYGRYLARVFDPTTGEDLNQWMLNSGLAVPYV